MEKVVSPFILGFNPQPWSNLKDGHDGEDESD